MKETINKSDLDNLTSTFKSCETTLNNFNSLKNFISYFITESPKQLKGSGYDAIRDKIGEFETALYQAKNLSQGIGEIKTANSNIINAMGGSSSVTYSKQILDELKHHLNNLRIEEVPTYKDEDAVDFNRRLREARRRYYELRKELIEKIAIIEDTMNAASSASSVVESCSSSVEQLHEKISSI